MKVYYAIDGDDIGKVIEKFLLEENGHSASLYSALVESKLGAIKSFFEQYDAEIIFCAGDSLLVKVIEIINLPIDLTEASDITFSIGIGDSLSNAVLALKKAKGLGKNRTIKLLGKPNDES